MAYASKDLSVLAYANGFTLWHYVSSTDNDATIRAATYFNDAADILRVGDIIIGNGSDKTGLYLVGDNDGRNVAVSDLTQVRSTDTD